MIRQNRKTKVQKQKKYFGFFAALILGVVSFVFICNSLAALIEENDVRVDTDAELTYYLTVKEDGVDASGTESSDAQVADIYGGRVSVTDKIPEGLEFQGFTTTSDGSIGAVSRSDSSVQCSGKVIDDTEEEIVDSGTWNAGHTEYYYHGLHYNAATRTVSFMAEKIKAGCELTVGIITKTPATVDDSSTTDIVEKRRDFYNTAFAAEKNLTATSNTVHAWIGSSTAQVRTVRYSYTGDVPAGAPTAPSDQSYPVNNKVAVSTNPILEGYTFSGWTTSDVTVTDGEFVMPDQDVELVGIWVQNPPSTEYTVSYVINGDKPADFMPPAQKSYEAGVEVSLDSTEAGAVIDGYRFSGWSTTDATLSETGFMMPEQNVTIAGSFERISYTVCYEFEGIILPPNASSLLPSCETHYPGDTVTRAADPEATGYDFLGWYKNETFTMPESNVVIHGEWAESLGKFIPTITKSLVDAQSEYMYGETVKFKTTVTNPESFAISDVYLQEQLAGAVFITSPTDSYTVKTSTVVVIPTIAAGASVDVFAEYKVTENTTQTLTNTVELTGALAENHVLDTDREYIATVDFNTIPEPVPFTGIIFNILPYIGLIVVAAGIVIIGILASRRLDIIGRIFRLKELISLRSRRMHGQYSLRYILPGFAILGLILGGVIAKNVVAENYTDVVKSVELTSQHVSFSNEDPGSWHVTKSAKWIAEGKARITFDVDTIAKVADQTNVDIVMVIDNSGSMGGEKITQVKHDSVELIESVLSDSQNRIGLVSFNSTATKLSSFTSDKTTLTNLVNGLNTTGCTNYYDGFLKAEEVLEGYQKQDGRELILLFLTDGYPNEQTPNEIAEYQALKAMYPYMTINAIQYEMGDEILDPIKKVSDNQYIANMDSLNNVLFEASISPYSYDNFILTDYINEDYWDVNSIDNIAASIGEATLGYSGTMPAVTWTITDLLKSGRSAQLTIDVTLKNANSIDDGTFLPTNDHETVQSELPGSEDENITSNSTPVLKSSYQVSYEANLPNDCTSYAGSLPDTQSYLPLTVVEKSSSNITCNGYIFAGWEVAEGNPKIINDDYFKIINDDVTLRATWTKVSISKSMDGEVKEEVFATLNTGQNVNVALKKLSGQSNPSYSTQNTTITAIRSASMMNESQLASAVIISTTDSAVPIYAWFDNEDGSIYVYSEADLIRGNTDMAYMFHNASSLTNIDGAANWDTSRVTSMRSIFSGASSLTNIDGAANWDTSSVNDMSYMFYGASSLTNIDGAAKWDTSRVTSMRYMFNNASNLTNIDGAAKWDTSSVINMSYMFSGASNLTNIDGAAKWDTSSVINMSYMFNNASSLTNIDGAANWDTSRVTSMAYMFYGASSLTNIDGAAKWDTSGVTSMSSMFSGASSLTNIDGAAKWDTSGVTSMLSMFYNASSLTNIDGAANWDTSRVINMSDMFYRASNLTNIDGAAKWDTSSVKDMSTMFRGASSLTNIDGAAKWDTSSVEDMSYMFNNASNLTNIDGAAKWDTSSVNDMSYMFSGASSLTDIDGAAKWDTSRVTSMRSIFSGASSLTNIDGAAKWDTSGVNDMSSMFYNASSLTDIDGAANWDTSSVKDMSSMFYRASSLTNIDGAAKWDTSSVTSMSSMFNNASSLTNIDGAAKWDTSSVINMSDMFFVASSLTNIDGAANWDTSSVNDMSVMFRDASSLTNIDGAAKWDTSSVINMSYMFYRASSLTDIDGAARWDTSSVTSMLSMFSGIPSSVTLPAWYTGT